MPLENCIMKYFLLRVYFFSSPGRVKLLSSSSSWKSSLSLSTSNFVDNFAVTKFTYQRPL